MNAFEVVITVSSVVQTQLAEMHRIDKKKQKQNTCM